MKGLKYKELSKDDNLHLIKTEIYTKEMENKNKISTQSSDSESVIKIPSLLFANFFTALASLANCEIFNYSFRLS